MHVYRFPNHFTETLYTEIYIAGHIEQLDIQIVLCHAQISVYLPSSAN